MAQIIKHRRGSLESISGATKRAGELLVVTGSAGITAANGNSILFVGIDGSTATPANKVLQGTEVPNLTGASYDTSIDGIPFYDTSAEKLYLLNKGGNVEIKATANTGGTGIVSSSAQVTQLLPTGTVSGSSQVVSILSPLNAFSASEEAKNSTLSSYTASVDVHIAAINTFSASEEAKNSTLSSYTASVDVHISAINAFSASEEAKNSTLSSYTASVNANLTELFATASNHETRVDALEAFSSSLGDGFATDAELQSLSSSVATSDGVQNQRLGSIEGFTASIDTTIKTKLNVEGVISSSAQVNADSITNFDANVKDKLNVEGVISGSSQVQIDSVTGFTSFSSSVDSRVDALEAAVGEGSNIDIRLDDLETFQASEEGKNATLATYTQSVEADLTELFATASNHEGRVDILELSQSAFDTAVTLDGQNVTVKGNFTVSGTQTIVDSTTVQIGDNILELNGSAAANGGLYVADATSPNLATGSLLWNSTTDRWVAGTKDNEITILLAGGDNVISGSSQVNADSITNFDANVKDKMNVDGVISGSVQVTISSTTGFSDFSSSLSSTDVAQKARLTSLESFSASADLDIIELFATASDHEVRIDAVEAFSSSLNNNFETRGQGIASSSAQIVSYLDSENVNLGGISGSSLNITGNAKIDGNLVLGGNITIGDASGDTISFGGEISSDIIPSANNTYDLGSSTDKFAEVHATNFYGTTNGVVNATNGVVSGSSQIVSILEPLNTFSASEESKNATLASYTQSVDAHIAAINTFSASEQSKNATLATYTASVDAHIAAVNSFTSSINTTIKSKLDADAVVSSSAQIVTLLSNQATDFGTGRVSADAIGNVDGSSTITGSFVGDGSGLTGLVTTLQITGSNGSASSVDLLTQGLSFASASGQGLGIAVSGQTVTLSNVNASTSAKGVASFDADDFSVSSGNVSIKSAGVRAVNLNADVAGTGITLNGVDNSIEVEYGATAGTAVEGDTLLTVQGTANEIEISGGAITLGNGGTVTVGLPNEVTIQTGSIVGDLTVGKDLTVVGNLFVQGTTTTIDSTTVQIGDNILELNGGGANANAGLLVTDVTSPNTNSGSLLWNSTADYWMGGALGAEKEFARFNSAPTSGSVQVIGANGLLVDAPITAAGIDVTITGDLTIGGLSANAFLVADGAKQLTAVSAVNAGDMIQWNGSSFVASNTIDGGTF